LSGGRKHIHKHKHKEEKKLEQKIERKQSFILNYNIQYLKPRKEKDVAMGEKQKELREKKKEKKKTLWPLQNNVLFDHGDCGFCSVLSRN
jgi:PP-loop superfamily ATP-utilizing enzyme